MRPEARIKRVVENQLSWRFSSAVVEACVTEAGGHLGPVTFDLRGKKFAPYSVAPWAHEPADPSLPPMLQVLRGDFFCLPFGGNSTAFHGEHHPVHGETANARWHFESLESQGGRTCLHLSLSTTIRRGRVDKRIFLVDRHSVVYSQHVVSGMKGPMDFGHHPMLRFPVTPGSGIISTSRFLLGQVLPGAFERPEMGGYSWLKPGAEFDSLERVPTITGEMADLSRFPARRGYEDLVMVVHDPALPWAWTAVTFPKLRRVWFSLKNPLVLRHTIFWISNGGRYYAPWNGRHINVMGIEDTTSFFHLGLAESVRPNALSEKGHPTFIRLHPNRPLVVPFIMGVVQVPSGFDRVSAIEAGPSPDTLTLVSANGKQATTAVTLEFLNADPGWST